MLNVERPVRARSMAGMGGTALRIGRARGLDDSPADRSFV